MGEGNSAMEGTGHSVSDLLSAAFSGSNSRCLPRVRLTRNVRFAVVFRPPKQGTLTANISVLEDYPQGYPRLAAFLALDRDFTVFKRFDYLHMRSLLEQQDELAELQERLDRCDNAEPIRLGLSSRRQDGNPERRELLRQVTVKLQEYDRCVQSYHGMLRLPEALKMQKQSVKHWYVGNKPLVRSESGCYMNCTHDHDYFALKAKAADRAGLETLVDVAMKMFPNVARHVSQQTLSLERRCCTIANF